jgi:hypothetical protein
MVFLSFVVRVKLGVIVLRFFLGEFERTAFAGDFFVGIIFENCVSKNFLLVFHSVRCFEEYKLKKFC